MKVEFATTSRLGRKSAKLLYIDNKIISHHQMQDLVNLIPKDSLMVVNQAATIPASFHGYVGSLPVELRLVRNLDTTLKSMKSWEGLLFYRGNWRIRTEERLLPDFLEIGDLIEIGGFHAEVTDIVHPSKRLITVKFRGRNSEIWNNIYKYGKPIQYSHLSEELKLWDIQTIFSSNPVAVEPPSASFQFSWEIINQLVTKGVEVVGLTHATSISSSGVKEIDNNLPFDEYYMINDQTAECIQTYIDQDLPIIGIGTSVTRALEDNFRRFGMLKSGLYSTSLVITPEFERRVITHLFTGMHLPEESHLQLLLNFVPSNILDEAYQEARERGYLWHEYGDVSLIKSIRQAKEKS